MQTDTVSLADYRKTLIGWWEQNARDFPWRHDRSLYRTAVAELMLRRTQADQVVPVFEKFIREYPDLTAAAGADTKQLATLLYPLGLVWRAEGMIRFFQEAHSRFGNDLPLDRELLQSLPGVGDYVSAAAVCFAGNQQVPLIDTNVVRVLGRIFGLRYDGEARRRAGMRRLATMAVDLDRPADYHYALLDFGARICIARKPRCQQCPFSTDERCQYYREHTDYVENRI